MEQTAREYTRPYVQRTPGGGPTTVFRSAVVPLGSSSNASNSDLIGPFKTMRAAQFVLDNPNFVGTVADAERAARS